MTQVKSANEFSGAVLAVRGVLGRAMRFLTAAVACLCVGTAMAAMAPEPDPVPRRWQLEIKPGDLRITTVEVPGVGPRMYFYFTYEVVNNSGEDLLFAPTFELATGEGDILRSGREVPQIVTSELASRTQDPLIEDQIKIIGELLQGEEHGKSGIAVWPVPDSAPERITIYAAGFSGETATVQAPGTNDKFVLRKTLRMDFDAPGELIGQRSRPIDLREQSWIMR